MAGILSFRAAEATPLAPFPTLYTFSWAQAKLNTDRLNLAAIHLPAITPRGLFLRWWLKNRVNSTSHLNGYCQLLVSSLQTFCLQLSTYINLWIRQSSTFSIRGFSPWPPFSFPLTTVFPPRNKISYSDPNISITSSCMHFYRYSSVLCEKLWFFVVLSYVLICALPNRPSPLCQTA